MSEKTNHHVLKVSKGYLQIMYNGLKSFDIRNGKREINIGDTVVFVENETNKQFACKVTFVIKSWEALPEWQWDLGDFVAFCWTLGEKES